jgi:hypothetical protein
MDVRAMIRGIPQVQRTGYFERGNIRKSFCGRKRIMSKFSRGASAWKEHRIADALEVDGAVYTVQLVARRGTGFQGYRVTLHFIPHEAGEEIQVELGSASSTADVHRMSRELTDEPARVEQLFAEAPPR